MYLQNRKFIRPFFSFSRPYIRIWLTDWLARVSNISHSDSVSLCQSCESCRGWKKCQEPEWQDPKLHGSKGWKRVRSRERERKKILRVSFQYMYHIYVYIRRCTFYTLGRIPTKFHSPQYAYSKSKLHIFDSRLLKNKFWVEPWLR